MDMRCERRVGSPTLLGLWSTLTEIFDVQSLDEVLENSELTLIDLDRGAWLTGLITFALKDHSGLIEHGLIHKNRDLCANRHGDRIARSGIDLDLLTVRIEHELSVKSLVGKPI